MMRPLLYLEDDGIGMEPEQVQKVPTGHGSSVRGSGFGIYNIRKRLKMLMREKSRTGLSYGTGQRDYGGNSPGQ
ncbi:MAG: sensor histidine kinase [Blautia faecis]